MRSHHGDDEQDEEAVVCLLRGYGILLPEPVVGLALLHLASRELQTTPPMLPRPPCFQSHAEVPMF